MELKLALTVCKALDILELLTQHQDMSLTEIAKQSDIDKPKAFRLLATLKEKGYVRKDAQSKKYSSSIKLFEMGNTIIANMGLKRIAHPFIRELADITGEAVNLAIRDGETMLYIDKIDSTSTIKVDLTLGKRMPLYCTGLGKALISDLSEIEITELFSDVEFIPYTENTVSNVRELISEISKIRERGYSIDNAEYIKGLLCIAAPVRGYSGKIVAAVSAAVPGFLYDDPKKFTKIVEAVMEISQSFSRQLSGYQE